MVYVYAADIRNLPDPKEFPEIMEGLDEKRKEKTLRYRQVLDRKQSLGAGLLQKQVLLHSGVDIKEIYYGENGKPEVEGICFNLSHSKEIVVCAVSRKAVGCDVEKTENAPENIAKRFFCEKEIEHLEKYEGEERRSEFYRIWTMKESYMKMTGEGMKVGLKNIEFALENPVKVYRKGELCSCFIKEYEFPGFKCTVCAEESEFAEKIEFMKL